MKKILNIVNGDTCIDIMKRAGVTGDFLPWRDFLHEGPVPPNLTLDELSKVRANFIAQYGVGAFKDIYSAFKQRDRVLKSFRDYEKITLWFEHDLYDQLQLIQILSWFEGEDLKDIELTLISTNEYLGESSELKIRKFLQYEINVSQEHMNLAKEAWHIFKLPTPIQWFELLNRPTSILPYLKAAILRMLEEYPNTRSGLSRSEYQALLIISNGITEPLDIFKKYQSFEERKFMGDVTFFKILEQFKESKVIESSDDGLQITPLGKKLLNGKENWVELTDFHRFIGGVELTKENLWCWDSEEKTVKKYYYSKVLKTLLLVK